MQTPSRAVDVFVPPHGTTHALFTAVTLHDLHSRLLKYTVDCDRQTREMPHTLRIGGGANAERCVCGKPRSRCSSSPRNSKNILVICHSTPIFEIRSRLLKYTVDYLPSDTQDATHHTPSNEFHEQNTSGNRREYERRAMRLWKATQLMYFVFPQRIIYQGTRYELFAAVRL